MDRGYIAIIVLGIALLLCISAAIAFLCRTDKEKAKAAIQQEQAVDLEAAIPCAIQSDVAVCPAPEHHKTPASPLRQGAELQERHSATSTPSSSSSSVRKKKKKSEATLPDLRLPRSLSHSNKVAPNVDESPAASPIPMDPLSP